jgi:hypothetical protein
LKTNSNKIENKIKYKNANNCTYGSRAPKQAVH